MKICANCFNDSDLRIRIISSNQIYFCDIHKKERINF